MTEVLGAFLNRSITLKEFNTMFQQETEGGWDVLGMGGTSGGMYLNKLVKYIDDDSLASYLRARFSLPEDTREGQRHMEELIDYFELLIAQQKGLRSQLQRARIPFLLSAWWHLQDAHYWPIFFPLVQRMLMSKDGQPTQAQSPIEAYFAFRTHFLSLAQALSLSLWELEHIVTWKAHRILSEQFARKMTRSSSLFEWKDIAIHSETRANLSIEWEEQHQCQKSEQERSDHTHIQSLLAKIGHQVGCYVWIAANHLSNRWNGERIG